MNTTKPVPRVMGYARASTEKQAESVDRQEAMIREKAQQVDGQWVRCWADDATSADKVPFDQRPEYARLMRELRSGDHLVVWRLDRIDRNPFRMIRAVEWLVNRGVNLHILDFGNLQLDLSTAQGRLLLVIMAAFAGYFVDQLREATSSALQWRKRNGLPYNGAPRPGFRRAFYWDKDRQRRRIMYVPDEAERWLVHQVGQRAMRGEPVASIHRDFQRRGAKTADGAKWSYHRVWRIARWYKAELEAGRTPFEESADGDPDIGGPNS